MPLFRLLRILLGEDLGRRRWWTERAKVAACAFVSACQHHTTTHRIGGIGANIRQKVRPIRQIPQSRRREPSIQPPQPVRPDDLAAYLPYRWIKMRRCRLLPYLGSACVSFYLFLSLVMVDGQQKPTLISSVGLVMRL